jgi:cytochrome c-type biogenesis protein CcmH
MSPLFLVLAAVLIISVTAMAVAGAAGRTKVLVASAAAIVVLVIGVYGLLGRPDLTRPRAATPEVLQARAMAKMDDTSAILKGSKTATVENWTDLANQYWALGSPRKAAGALASAASIAKTPVERDGLLGAQAQALVTANNKQVGPAAQALFADILSRNPDDLRALFFLGLAAEKAGDKAANEKYWGHIINVAPADTPWRKTLEARMGRVGEAPASPAPAAAGTLSLPEGPQRDMIMGMVARLAERLADSGGSAEEWAKLGRSYGVLGRNEEALTAYNKALELAPNDPAIQSARDGIAAQTQ